MTSRDEQVFAQGVLFGAALAAHQARQELGELDQRLQRLERERRSPPRPRIRLIPAGWRDGRRAYHIGRWG